MFTDRLTKTLPKEGFIEFIRQIRLVNIEEQLKNHQPPEYPEFDEKNLEFAASEYE